MNTHEMATQLRAAGWTQDRKVHQVYDKAWINPATKKKHTLKDAFYILENPETPTDTSARLADVSTDAPRRGRRNRGDETESTTEATA